MQIKVGTDVVEVKRIKAAYERHGRKFFERFLDAEEINYAYNNKQAKYNYSTVAGLYAAKEALSKALGTGIAAGIKFHEIKIAHDQEQAPFYKLSGETAKKFKELGFTKHSLSISHDAGISIAVCVIYS